MLQHSPTHRQRERILHVFHQHLRLHSTSRPHPGPELRMWLIFFNHRSGRVLGHQPIRKLCHVVTESGLSVSACLQQQQWWHKHELKLLLNCKVLRTSHGSPFLLASQEDKDEYSQSVPALRPVMAPFIRFALPLSSKLRMSAVKPESYLTITRLADRLQ